MVKFAERLKELREERNMTQSEISKATGINVITISRWENGSRIPGLESIEKLVKFFGCSAGYLIGTED